MSTLHNLNLALIDVQDKLQRELQMSVDSQKLIADAMGTVFQSLQQLERAIHTAFEERHRALSLAIGSGKPSPETVDHSQVRSGIPHHA